MSDEVDSRKSITCKLRFSSVTRSLSQCFVYLFGAPSFFTISHISYKTLPFLHGFPNFFELCCLKPSKIKTHGLEFILKKNSMLYFQIIHIHYKSVGICIALFFEYFVEKVQKHSYKNVFS